MKGDKKRKTKEILLREMIMRASHDHADGGDAVSGLSHVNSSSVPGTLLLTLDHITLFFYTLSSQRHVASVEHWQSAINKNFNPSSTSVPTGPPLTYVSARSSTTSTSKCQYDANDPIINLCGPTPKKPRIYTSRTVTKAIVDSKVKVGINCEDDDWYGSDLSDRDKMNDPEAIAACLSPFKSWAQAMNSVSKF